MKVKNIAFSGFAAAILMAVSGAAQAAEVSPVRLASQGYVNTQVGKKQDKLTAANQGEGIKLNMDTNGNLNTISVDWESVASNDTVAEKISEAITGGAEFDKAVSDAIDEAVANGAVGNAISSAVNTAVSTKADQADLESLGVTVGQNTQAAANAQNAADAAQADATQALADAAAAQADATQALADAAANAVNIATNTSDIAELKAIDHTQYATNTTVNALTETVNTKAAQSAVDSLSQKVTALEGADHFTQDDADALYASKSVQTAVEAEGTGLAATYQLANQANTAAGTNAAAITDLQTADTALGNRLNALETADHFTQDDADALYASKSVQTAVEAEGTGLAATYQLASQANSAAAAAQADVNSLESAVAEANYMSGNNIGAGSYLMMSDGKGGISWSSVVIVDENGDDIELPSDAPKTL